MTDLGVEHILVIVHHDVGEGQHVARQKVGAPALLAPIFPHVMQRVPAQQQRALIRARAHQPPSNTLFRHPCPRTASPTILLLLQEPAPLSISVPHEREGSKDHQCEMLAARATLSSRHLGTGCKSAREGDKRLHASIHDAFCPCCLQALIELARLDVRVAGLGLAHPGRRQLPAL